MGKFACIYPKIEFPLFSFLFSGPFINKFATQYPNRYICIENTFCGLRCMDLVN